MKLLAILCLVSISFSIYVPQNTLPANPIQVLTPNLAQTAPLVQNFTLLAQRSTQGGFVNGLAAAKMSSDSKCDIITYKAVYSQGGVSYQKEKNTTYYLYSYDGTSINYLGSSPPYNGGLKELYLYHEANPAKGKLALGGYYKPNTSSTAQYYGTLQYSSGAMNTPAKASLLFDTSVKDRTVQALSAGDIFGSSSQETLIIFKESQPMKVSRSLLYIPNGSSHYQYEFPKFTSVSVAVGDFYPAAGNEIAVVGNGYNDESWLYLLKVEGNAIAKLSSRTLDVEEGQEADFYYPAAADLDGDGYDDLLLAGKQKPSGTNSAVSTSLFHIYKYATSGWALKNSYVFNDMLNHSSVYSIGVTDVDLDGKDEIVVANDYDYWAGGTSCHNLKVSMFEYEPSKPAPTLFSTSTIGSSSQCITPNGAVIADFDGNGRKELALAHYDGSDNVIALYSLGYSAPANNTTSPGSFTIPQMPIPNIGNAVEQEAPAVEVPTGDEPEAAVEEPALPLEEQPAAPAQEPAITTPETPALGGEPAVAPETPSTPPAAVPGAPSTDSAKAQQAVSSLQASVASAKEQGADTASAEQYLAKAEQSLSAGSYSQASMDASRGETLVQAALARIGAAPSSTAPAAGEQSGRSPAQAPTWQPAAQPSESPAASAQQTDYTPYYIGAAAVVILGVAYMFTHGQQPSRRKK